MFADQHSHTICTGITSPGTKKDQPYEEISIRKLSGKINKGQHYCHIDYTKNAGMTCSALNSDK